MNAPKPQKRCRLECNADGHPNTAEPEFGGEDDRYASWATCVDCGALVPFGAYDASCNAADQLESPNLDDCECPDCRSNAFWSPPQTWPKAIRLPWRHEGERRSAAYSWARLAVVWCQKVEFKTAPPSFKAWRNRLNARTPRPDDWSWVAAELDRLCAARGR